MGIFRSEDMFFYKFTCLKDNAWKVISELGKLDSLDFVDLNRDEQVFNMTYGTQLKRCDEVLRNLAMLEEECKDMGLDLSQPENREELESIITLIEQLHKKSQHSLFDEVESKVNAWKKFTYDTMKSLKEVKERYFGMLMYREVVQFVDAKYKEAHKVDERQGSKVEDEKEEALININANDGLNTISTTNIAGVIDKVDTQRMRRLIFRATRGKAMVITSDIDSELLKREGFAVPKAAYLVIFQSGDFMFDRIKKI
jgi:V-type H+-transporting ATPase subunit a